MQTATDPIHGWLGGWERQRASEAHERRTQITPRMHIIELTVGGGGGGGVCG